MTYFVENFEKMRHPTPDMATILAATFTIRRKRLKLSSVARKRARDQIEKVSKEAVR